MKTKFLKSIFAAVLALSLFSFGCKKNDTTATRLELLTRAGWIQTNSEIRTNNNLTWQVDPFWTSTQSCDRDNVLLFNANGSFELSEGASKCSLNDPNVIYIGSWSFSSGETSIIVGSEAAAIEILDQNTLQITTQYTSGGTTEYSRDTFRH